MSNTTITTTPVKSIKLVKVTGITVRDSRGHTINSPFVIYVRSSKMKRIEGMLGFNTTGVVITPIDNNADLPAHIRKMVGIA